MNSKRIAHIAVDGIFLKCAYDSFEKVAEGQSDYFVFKNKGGVRFSKDIQYIPIKRIDKFNPLFIKKLANYDAVIFHSMISDSFRIAFQLSFYKVKMVWFGWGYDYYRLLKEYNENSGLLGKTKVEYQKVAETENKKTSFKVRIKNKISTLLLSDNRKIRIIKKLDFFAPVIKCEYDLLREECGRPFPEYIKWNYVKDFDINKESPLSLSAEDECILLGNSGTPNNNHFEMIDLLDTLDFGGRKVICPLSNGKQEYAKLVMEYGKQKLGDNFEAFNEFMNYDRYKELIAPCKIVFMNHLRQKGLGNIFITMCAGAKVFIRDENPLTKYFKEKGFKFFSINSLEEKKYGLDVAFTEEDKLRNKQLILEDFSIETTEKDTANLLKKLL